jgi:DNA-directed RNA polymerase specialized sigma24 family protein
MAPAGNNPRAQRAGSSGAPVKLVNSAIAVNETWLTEFEKLAAAEHLARLDTDRELVSELRRNNFEGVHYNYYAIELAKYGMAVIAGWTRRGLIMEKVKRHSFGGLPSLDQKELADPNNAQTLADETVAIALRAFREDVLIPGKWDPDKGASIKTFFVGQCLMQFPNVYRRWHRENYTDAPRLTEDGDLSTHIDVIQNVESEAITQERLRKAFARIKDPRVRDAFVMIAAGLTHEEVGVKLNVTSKTVERMIANERARLSKGNVA